MTKIALTFLAALSILLGSASVIMPAHASNYQFAPACSTCNG